MNKTMPTNVSFADYLHSMNDDQRRIDARGLATLMQEETGCEPVMWGPSIVGFGNHHYVYESGREGDDPAVSFAVRKNALTLYGVLFYLHNETNVELAKNLGPHTHGKGCLYIKSLGEIDLAVLRKMISNAFLARSDKK